MAAEGSTNVVLAALAGNVVITAAKFGAAVMTGSSAMLSSAVHALIDGCHQILLLHGLQRSARPAAASHPFGHGKELYFWSFVVAIALFSMGAGVAIYEGAARISRPEALREVLRDPEVNYLVIAVATLIQGGSIVMAVRAANSRRGSTPFLQALRASKDPTIFTVTLEAVAGVAGLGVALAGIAAVHLGGIAEADGIASIVIGLIMGLVAALFALEVKNLLTTEAATDAPREAPRDDPDRGRAARVAAAPAPTAAAAATPVLSVYPHQTVETPQPSPAPAASQPAPDGKPRLQAKPEQPRKKGRGKRRR